MTFDSSYRQSKYIASVRERLQRVYSVGEKTSKRAKYRDQLEGYLKAGLLLGVIEESDIHNIVNEEHHKAYGTSLKERELRSKLPEHEQKPNWDSYDRPSYQRNR
jgi:hypothetical protein